ncbi:hypothetical protein [Bailinhaonella thermotolerans]|uniref:DUF8083 domain-containing protein n=1 Tax=Bailinhaonella thermotolerans TaxID=1070861 RepID=A0A3A4AQU5_9ACTN|nr:hypothetical protein [Bailinhaonella thermotolerans]RJL30979.1 hypothetical protein D5H75_22110 [Bailinhaonella thermotolerans]
MLPYSAYLRVYEPLSAFTDPERTAWAAYAVSETRPRRAESLSVEHRDAVRRLLAVPPIVAPDRESRNAYLRRIEDRLYVCPWQTRLRSWLEFTRFRGSVPANLLESFVPAPVVEMVASDFERYKERGGASALRTHILSSNWNVPTPWFVPFDSSERWLVLGGPAAAEQQQQQAAARDSGATTATPTRNLIYVTSMADARRRVARALGVIRRNLGEIVTVTQVEEVGRWLEEFHPHSLVELDYGGLVHLLDDEALRSDQSVAEVTAALSGLDAGQEEVAVAMYQRVTARWRAVQALESAN